MSETKHFRGHAGGFRWEGVDLHAYKEESSAPFKDITRQTLFRDEMISGELRYFEIAPGGHSTLERHEHVHAVMVLRGKGRCLVGGELRDIGELDLVSIPPMTWHQFRAADDEPPGFLCMVDHERDRPQLPDADDLAELNARADIAAFIRAG
ncbi:MAG: cupin domain-containing protein [Rhodomicrobiaceae bacterium]